MILSDTEQNTTEETQNMLTHALETFTTSEMENSLPHDENFLEETLKG